MKLLCLRVCTRACYLGMGITGIASYPHQGRLPTTLRNDRVLFFEMLSNDYLHVNVASSGIFTLQPEMMPSAIATNGDAEVHSTTVEVRENGSAYLDTITEEEEE